MKTCRHHIDWTAFLLEELSASDKTAAEKQLHSCDSCKTACEETRQTLELMGMALSESDTEPPLRLSAERRAAVLASAERDRSDTRDRSDIKWLPLLSKIAAILIVTFGVAYLALPLMSGNRSKSMHISMDNSTFSYEAPPPRLADMITEEPEESPGNAKHPSPPKLEERRRKLGTELADQIGSKKHSQVTNGLPNILSEETDASKRAKTPLYAAEAAMPAPVLEDIPQLGTLFEAEPSKKPATPVIVAGSRSRQEGAELRGGTTFKVEEAAREPKATAKRLSGVQDFAYGDSLDTRGLGLSADVPAEKTGKKVTSTDGKEAADELMKEARGYYKIGDLDAAQDLNEKVLLTDRYNKDAMRNLDKIAQKRRDAADTARVAAVSSAMTSVRERWNPPIVDPNISDTDGDGLSDGSEMLKFKSGNSSDLNGKKETKGKTDPSDRGFTEDLRSLVYGATGVETAPPKKKPDSSAHTSWAISGYGLADSDADSNKELKEATEELGARSNKTAGGLNQWEWHHNNKSKPEAPQAETSVKETKVVNSFGGFGDDINYDEWDSFDDDWSDSSFGGEADYKLEGNVKTTIYNVTPNISDKLIGNEDIENSSSQDSGGRFIEMSSSSKTIERADNKRYFVEKGIAFPPGTSVSYNPTTSQLIVSNTPENLEDMDKLIKNANYYVPPGPKQTASDEVVQTEVPAEKTEAEITRDQLNDVEIANVDFRNADISEVLAYIAETTKQSGEGIDIELQGLPEVSKRAKVSDFAKTDLSNETEDDTWESDMEEYATESVPSQQTVSLTLRNVSAMESLKIITELNELKFRVKDGKVVVYPQGMILGSVETRMYPVFPSIIDVIITEGGDLDSATGTGGGFIEMEETREDIMEFFSQMGVPFPEGTSASYDHKTSQMIVSNSPENLEKFELILSKINIEPEPGLSDLLFIETTNQPLSTFSIDCDTASYTLCRRLLNEGQRPTAEQVRIEEFINYFDYHYPSPKNAAFAAYNTAAPNPLVPGSSLLNIGVKAKVLGRDQQRPLNLVLAIDTSGSMATADRIGLLRSSLDMLLGQLSSNDRITMVSFGAKANLLMESTAASDKGKILTTFDAIRPTGATHLEKGLKLAYSQAADHYDTDAINRVVLCSDGRSNLGSGNADLVLAHVEQYRKQGIYLSIFGFGSSEYDDAMLKQLALKGDGTYAFIDSLKEAKRQLVDNLAASLQIVARDVKIQVEFNPDAVKAYRQLGYEKRQLKEEQFRDDTVDAGEIGSGASVTALYEMELVPGSIAPLGSVAVRHTDPHDGSVTELNYPIKRSDLKERAEEASPEFRLALAAAACAEQLRGGPVASRIDKAELERLLRRCAAERPLDPNVQELMRLFTK